MAKLKQRPKTDRDITFEELKRAVKKMDVSHIFIEAAQKAWPEMEAYRQVRAKSKAKACCTVFY
jgi:hypothetical protein